MRLIHFTLICFALVFASEAGAAKHKRPKLVRPSSVPIVGSDFQAMVPQGWFDLERIQLEETKASDETEKRDLNLLLMTYRQVRADGGEMMMAGIDGSHALMTISPIEDAKIQKSKLGEDAYCNAIGHVMIPKGERLEYAKPIEIRNGLKTCSLASMTATGKKYAGVIMWGKKHPYLVMTSAEKGTELPTQSLQAFVESWYLK
jgi:hypothetical protein